MCTLSRVVAVLMLLWLPLSSGIALAASISMQLQHGSCAESASTQSIAHEDMAAHHQHHEQAPDAVDKQDSFCNSCVVCQLACVGYLASPNVEAAAEQATFLENTPFLVVFNSFVPAPLVPPPLARA